MRNKTQSPVTPDKSFAAHSFGWIGFPITLLLVACIGCLPMTWQQQALFGTLMVLAAIVVGRASSGRLATLIIVLLSMCATARYAVWRVDSLRRYFFSPWSVVNGMDSFFMLLLLSAELYSFVILYLGFMQTIAPLRRTPVPLPEDVEEWPTVDILIPTFNEPIEVVRYTVLAAKQQDWPEEKFKVWLLDDGNRQDFRDFAAEAGVGYIARPEHNHAKAGNINYALERTSGDLVAIFDCDHVPTRSFLQVTAGWFLHDAKLGMLQTPHHFYSPDPFERNLGNFRSIPSESELFYGIIQDTNDLWNATFFCGSCAVLRRESLNEVGGIAHETVTEDAHTSLRMQKLRWNTAYINLPQAAGLATETLADHVKQRVRWARGMSQILRVDNPLFARGLTWPQRLCYLNAMLHFLYALPRLIFLTAPVLYLVFGKLNIPGYWLAILVFAMPHLVIANFINSRIQGFKRYSFWNEIYETVLSPYILLPTLFALISPKFGKFNVTAKGQNLQEDSFDSKLARPFLLLLALNAIALGMAIPRYLYWDQGHAGTVFMNVIWTLFNTGVLSVALSACWETCQRRQAVRVSTSIPVQVKVRETTVSGTVRDLSVGGASMSGAVFPWQPGDKVAVTFHACECDYSFPAVVVGVEHGRTRLAFATASLEEQQAITRVLFLASDRWIDWTLGRSRDKIFGSFLAVLMAALVGVRKMLRLLHPRPPQPSRVPALARGVGMVLLILGALLLAFRAAHAEAVQASPAPSASVRVAFRALGAKNGILLNGSNRNQGLAIALPDDVLVEEGTLHLKYTLPQATESPSTLEVILNDLLLASITPSASELASGHGEVDVPLPPEQLVRQNRITLQLANTSGNACFVTDKTGSPIRIDPDSDITLKEQRLVLANDLSLLPAPFAQRSATQASEIAVVFAHAPNHKTLEAAGMLASWFGSQSVQGETHFVVSVGSVPPGNAVVVLLDGDTVGGVAATLSGKAELRIANNPADPYGKLLVLSGPTEHDLLHLTRSLAAGQLILLGDRAVSSDTVLPGRRQPDDAPRWIHSRRVSLQELAGTEHVRTAGDNPLNLYLRFAPDYDFGVHREMYLHFNYSHDAPALGPSSNMVVRLNGSPAKSVPIAAMSERQHQVNIPLGDLPASSFANTLQIQFYFVPPAGQECQANRYTADMSNGSFLDLGEVSHLAKLPNLNLFSKAGFPFTRRADLSDTAILLPHEPSAEEISEYLNLLAYFGTATGYPALRVTVGEISAAPRFAAYDLLVLGTYRDLAAMPAVSDQLPIRFTADGWRLSTRARLVHWARGLLHFARTGVADSNLGEGQIAPAGMLESIRSPFDSHRSVVVLLARDSVAVAAMRDGLLAELPHDGISGTASLWQEGSFVSYDLSTPSYRIGDVSTLQRLQLTLPENPWYLIAALLVACVALAMWIQVALAARIQQRLMGVPQFHEHFEEGNA